MVKIHVKTAFKEVPVGELVAEQFFAEHVKEFGGQIDAARFRFTRHGKILNPEDLKKLTDRDAIRLIALPASKVQKPIDPATDPRRPSIDAQLASLAAPFKNPQDRRLHGFYHEFSFPDHITKLLKEHPQLIYHNRLLAILNDFYLFRAYIFFNDFKLDLARNDFKYDTPDFYPIIKSIVFTIAERYGLRMVERPAGQEHRPAGQPAPAITQSFLQNALQAVLAGVANPPPPPQAPPGSPAEPAQPAQPAPEPMQQGYEAQLETLRSFGFENDELILLALEQANGEVEAAMEFLIELNN